MSSGWAKLAEPRELQGVMETSGIQAVYSIFWKDVKACIC